MAKPPKPRKWTPMHPQKYEGDPTNIITRSSWEVKFFNWCDSNPHVISYSSEEVVVPYRCPTDGKVHRYFVDAKIKLAQKTGIPKVYLIEIKPMEQCSPPKMGKNRQRYITEAMTFVKNQAKWQAASQYAAERGWEFKVLTQKDLGL